MTSGGEDANSTAFSLILYICLVCVCVFSVWWVMIGNWLAMFMGFDLAIFFPPPPYQQHLHYENAYTEPMNFLYFSHVDHEMHPDWVGGGTQFTFSHDMFTNSRAKKEILRTLQELQITIFTHEKPVFYVSRKTYCPPGQTTCCELSNGQLRANFGSTIRVGHPCLSLFIFVSLIVLYFLHITSVLYFT